MALRAILALRFRTMELRQLRYFLAVAETLHFGRAAEQLHMAQPPLSQQIQRLEAELGFALFERNKRRVRLTAAGEVFQRGVEATLAQLDRAIQTAQGTSRGEQGHLALGFVSSAAYNVLPTILQRFRQAYPQVALGLQELSTDAQIGQLRRGQIDVGLLRPPLEDGMLELRVIWEEPLILALPEQHPCATPCLESPGTAEWVDLGAIAAEPFILFPRPLAPRLYDQILGLCQRANFSPTVVQEATQMQTIVSLVAAGLGVAIVPESLRNLQRLGVAYCNIQGETPRAAVAVAWRRDNRSEVLQSFLRLLDEGLLGL